MPIPMLTNEQIDVMAMKLAKELDGLLIGDAQAVLNKAGSWLRSTHRVNVANSEFQITLEELDHASAERDKWPR